MKNQRGFTIIEMIVTLILVGIMATLGGMGIVTAMRGYLFAKDNSANSQKANLALSRLNREFQELITIPAAMTANATGTALLYQRLANGVATTFSVGLDGNTVKIKSAAASINDYTNGETIIDNVVPSTGFALSYYDGSNAWGKTDIRRLSTIRINLTLNQPSTGNPISFSTTVNPRNNNNTGGAPPPTGSSGSLPSGCFIATAAFGNDNHPIVLLLRAFRDRVLLKSDAGKSFVNIYYRLSPPLAKTIENRPVAMFITRFALLPIIGAAYLLLYFSWWIIPVLFILGFFSARWLTAKLRWLQPFQSLKRLASDRKGSVMIGLIITMVIMASLGAAMTALLPSASMSQIGSNFAQKAYFLSESGFRYAASEFLAATNATKEDTLKNNLDNHTFILSGSDGRFHLRIYPFYHRTTNAYAIGATQINTEVPGTIPAELDARYNTASSGRLKIGSLFYQYNSTSHTASSRNVTFILTTPLSVAVTNNQTISAAAQRTGNTNDTITIASNEASAFPLLHGNFRIDGLTGTNADRIWGYTRRIGNTLVGIKALDNPAVDLTGITINAANYIVLEKFAKVLSTGIYANGTNLEAKREILYNTPIGFVGPGVTAGKKSKQETFDSNSMLNFPTGSDQSIGTHVNLAFGSGDYVLDVTTAQRFGAFGTRQYWSAIAYDWSSANADLALAWRNTGWTLSTDLQVKIRVQNQPKFFMAGIGFKGQGYDPNGNPGDGDETVDTYGVSFVRARQCWGHNGTIFSSNAWRNQCGVIIADLVDDDGIPDELIPGATVNSTTGLFSGSLYEDTANDKRYSQPAIVLWKATGNNFQWLAYKILTNTDYVVTAGGGTNNLNLKDWSSIQVRAIESYPLPFRNGGPTTFMYGDIVTVMRGGTNLTTFRINGSPILTNANWSTNQAQGTLLLSNVDTTISFLNTDDLYVHGVKRGEVNMSGTLLNQKKNYIKVYYADTDVHGTANAVATDNNRYGNPRSALVHWPVDDISSWAPANDYMTLVNWANDVQGGIQLLSSVGEGSNIIIQDSSFLTPNSGNVIDRAGIYLYTAGGDAILNYNPPEQFDDFALQWEGEYGHGSGTGFLPPLQQ